jgi:ligand-binding sensor domain-containing protein
MQVFTFLTILLFGTACNGPVKKSLQQETEHPKLIKTIGNGNVQCSLQDKAGNLWFGTTGDGIYKYDGKTFNQLTVNEGLNSNYINSILEDKDGKLWIGTEVGLILYDGKTFTEIKITLPKDLPPNKYRKTHDVFNIMQDKSGKLWFATIDGVYIYDGKSFTSFIVNEGVGGFKSSNNNVEYILEDKEGNIWFGGRPNEGVFRYDGKSVTNFKLNELFQNGQKSIAHNWAWPQLQDKNGNIWFSNWAGAYRYDGKSFTSFTEKDGLYGGVTRIIEDKKRNLWFGGDGGAGISRYDGKSFKRFTTKDGLLNQSIWSIWKIKLEIFG